MFAASATAEIFRCPGEDYDISRSVHLARVAAFYSKCRDCPHAPGGDGLPTVAAECLKSTMDRSPFTAGRHASLFTLEGVRGRYLNELTRALASEIAGAMASCLWDEFVSSAQPAGSVSVLVD